MVEYVCVLSIGRVKMEPYAQFNASLGEELPVAGTAFSPDVLIESFNFFCMMQLEAQLRLLKVGLL